MIITTNLPEVTKRQRESIDCKELCRGEFTTTICEINSQILAVMLLK